MVKYFWNYFRVFLIKILIRVFFIIGKFFSIRLQFGNRVREMDFNNFFKGRWVDFLFCLLLGVLNINLDLFYYWEFIYLVVNLFMVKVVDFFWIWLRDVRIW